LISNARRIPQFEQLCATLGMAVTPDALAPDRESPLLLDALSEIKEWREPTKRGKRVFDDQSFVKSVSEQFARKGALSERQRGAMKKLVMRYKGQISNFEDRIAALGMKVESAAKPADSEEV
jgi:hypothetical protein